MVGTLELLARSEVLALSGDALEVVSVVLEATFHIFIRWGSIIKSVPGLEIKVSGVPVSRLVRVRETSTRAPVVCAWYHRDAQFGIRYGCGGYVDGNVP